MITLLVLLFFFWPLLILAIPPVWRLGRGDTLVYVGGQLISWWATFVGWFLLIYPCWKQLWVLKELSTNQVLPQRVVDQWTWEWLNPVYSQPEDGVSAQQALIRDDAGNPVKYMPTTNASWRAYCWNCRNSADGLKYLLVNDNGKLVLVNVLGRTVKFGWLPMPQLKGAPRVPVLG
jgi:hypothetical protein